VNVKGDECHALTAKASMPSAISPASKTWLKRYFLQNETSAATDGGVIGLFRQHLRDDRPAMAALTDEEFAAALQEKEPQALRDWLITEQDVRNVRSEYEGTNWKRHTSPGESVRRWTQSEQEKFFFYQEPVYAPAKAGQDPVETTPYILGIQTPSMLEAMLTHGNQRALALDTTFGTNSNKVRSAFVLKYIFFLLLLPKSVLLTVFAVPSGHRAGV